MSSQCPAILTKQAWSIYKGFITCMYMAFGEIFLAGNGMQVVLLSAWVANYSELRLFHPMPSRFALTQSRFTPTQSRFAPIQSRFAPTQNYIWIQWLFNHTNV